MASRAKSTRAGPAFMLAGDESGDPEVSRLEARLTVDRTRLGTELSEHPDLYYRAALIRARLEAELGKAERDVLAAEGRAADSIRAGNDRRDVPLTEDQITAWVRRTAEVDAAGRAVGEAKRRLLLAHALEHAYAQRGRVLELLTEEVTTRPPAGGGY